MGGSDAIANAEQNVAELQKQINAYRGLSTSRTYEEQKLSDEVNCEFCKKKF